MESNNHKVLLALLTPREHRVLDWLAAGLTDHQIADNLGLASWRSTVRIVGVIRDKLDARNRTHAVALYLKAIHQ